jgi:dynein heavy chain
LQFLKEHLLDVERIIQPGLTRLDWNSVGIEEYSRDCQQVLKNLASLVTQTGKIGAEVQAAIDCLGRFDFFCFEKSEQGAARLSCKVIVLNTIYRKLRLLIIS